MIKVIELGMIDINESDKEEKYYNLSFILEDTSETDSNFKFATRFHQWVMYNMEDNTIHPYRSFVFRECKPIDIIKDKYDYTIGVYDFKEFCDVYPDDEENYKAIHEYIQNEEVKKSIEKLIIDSLI